MPRTITAEPRIQVPLRFTSELREQVLLYAARYGWSQNKALVELLRAGLAAQQDGSAPAATGPTHGPILSRQAGHADRTP